MTALATGLALVPLAVAGSIPGHEIEHPMAIVILGGLVTSTLLNLFVLPSLYLRFGKSKRARNCRRVRSAGLTTAAIRRRRPPPASTHDHAPPGSSWGAWLIAVDESRDSRERPCAAESKQGSDGDVTLEARGLKKAYGNVVARRGAELRRACRARCSALLGPNGAGQDHRDPRADDDPRADRRQLRGRGNPAHASGGDPAADRRAARERRLSRAADGEEFLRYYARLFGHSRGERPRRPRQVCWPRSAWPSAASSRIATYSRGMRQRLGIARALVNEPEVVFFDEPTLGLDPAGQRQVLRLVAGSRASAARPSSSARTSSPRSRRPARASLILNRGRVVAEGTVAEVTRRAAAPRRGRFRVPAELRDRALAASRSVPGIGDVQPLDGRADWVTVDLRRRSDRGGRRGRHVSDGVRALADAGHPAARVRARGRAPERRLPRDDRGGLR